MGRFFGTVLERAVSGGSHAAGAVGGVKSPDEEMVEMEVRDILIEVLEADELACKGAPDEAQDPSIFDPAVWTHAPGLPGVWIRGQRWDAKAAWRGGIEVGWDLSAQGLMGALGVVLMSPAIQSALLGARVGRGWSGRFGFEHAVHLLMGAIILRLAAAGKLDANAESDPPQAGGR
jgi:hypothetical protein